MKNIVLFLVVFSVQFLNVYSIVFSNIGCNHPLQDGTSSSKKMIELVQKEAKLRKSQITVLYNNDTCYIETDKMVMDNNVLEFTKVKFFKEQIVEVSYCYEFSTENEKDSFCSTFVENLRGNPSQFTEISNDKAIHHNVNSFWNFISLCKGKKFMLAVSVETLQTVNPTVCITYLY